MNSNKIYKNWVVVLMAATMFSPALRAQSTEGFFLGLHLNGSAWKLNDVSGSQENGGGGGVLLGYGFSNIVGLYAGFDAAVMGQEGADDYLLGHFDIGTQLHLMPGSSFQPFVDVALNGRAAEWTDPIDTSTSGGGLSAGGGIKFFASSAVALAASIKWSFGKLQALEVSGVSLPFDESATSARVNLGVVIYP